MRRKWAKTANAPPPLGSKIPNRACKHVLYDDHKKMPKPPYPRIKCLPVILLIVFIDAVSNTASGYFKFVHPFKNIIFPIRESPHIDLPCFNLTGNCFEATLSYQPARMSAASRIRDVKTKLHSNVSDNVRRT